MQRIRAYGWGNQISAEGGRVGDPDSWERLLSAWISGALPEAHGGHINFMQYSDSLILKSTKGCPWMITLEVKRLVQYPSLEDRYSPMSFCYPVMFGQ